MIVHCNECQQTFPSIQHMYGLYQCPKCMLFNTEITKNVCSDEQKQEYEEHIKTIPGYVTSPELTLDNIKRFVDHRYEKSPEDKRKEALSLLSSLWDLGLAERISQTISNLLIVNELPDDLGLLLRVILLPPGADVE